MGKYRQSIACIASVMGDETAAEPAKEAAPLGDLDERSGSAAIESPLGDLAPGAAAKGDNCFTQDGVTEIAPAPARTAFELDGPAVPRAATRTMLGGDEVSASEEAAAQRL